MQLLAERKKPCCTAYLYIITIFWEQNKVFVLIELKTVFLKWEKDEKPSKKGKRSTSIGGRKKDYFTFLSDYLKTACCHEYSFECG